MRRITGADRNERIKILDDHNWDLDALIDKVIELQEENEKLLDKIGGMEDRIAELEQVVDGL